MDCTSDFCRLALRRVDELVKQEGGARGFPVSAFVLEMWTGTCFPAADDRRFIAAPRLSQQIDLLLFGQLFEPRLGGIGIIRQEDDNPAIFLSV